MKINLSKIIQSALINCSLSGSTINVTFCEAQGSYTLIYFEGGKSTMVSYRLGLIQKALNKDDFIRCHKSYLVNIREIKEISIKKRIFILKNGNSVCISRSALKEIISSHSNMVEAIIS